MQYHKLGAYHQAAHTVGKTRQIVMLYDGMIRFLQQARAAMEEGRIEDRFHLLTKVSNILSGLQGCLDFEQSEEVSTTLYDYYAARELDVFTLNRTNSVQECDALIENLKTMRGAWHEIDISQGVPNTTPDPFVPAVGGTMNNAPTAHYATSETLDALMISA
jgi:flagellar secretion chaperone FliS